MSRSVTAPPRLPFTAPWLLAPMEGVTAPSFRDLVLARHEPGELGGASTEFVRVLDRPVLARELERHLGRNRFPIPVGLQLMGAVPELLAASAGVAVDAGAAWIDLNFGCPAKGALRGCAGGATLKDPDRIEGAVAACVDAVGTRVPVTAKIRAGHDDADDVEELARAAERGGASLLTVHCRTVAEGYADDVDWTRITRAVRAVSIPVCGNGGVRRRSDLARMRAETGCAYVMVGHGALADPWIFSGRKVSRAEAAGFLLEYHERLRVAGGGNVLGPVKRLKQLLRTWSAGDLVTDEADRRRWMREADGEALLDRLRELRGKEKGEGPLAPPPPDSSPAGGFRAFSSSR